MGFDYGERILKNKGQIFELFPIRTQFSEKREEQNCSLLRITKK
jgi:hypothetical protein